VSNTKFLVVLAIIVFPMIVIIILQEIIDTNNDSERRRIEKGWKYCFICHKIVPGWFIKQTTWPPEIMCLVCLGENLKYPTKKEIKLMEKTQEILEK
jgi:hypothetical protein